MAESSTSFHVNTYCLEIDDSYASSDVSRSSDDSNETLTASESESSPLMDNPMMGVINEEDWKELLQQKKAVDPSCTWEAEQYRPPLQQPNLPTIHEEECDFLDGRILEQSRILNAYKNTNEERILAHGTDEEKSVFFELFQDIIPEELPGYVGHVCDYSGKPRPTEARIQRAYDTMTDILNLQLEKEVKKGRLHKSVLLLVDRIRDNMTDGQAKLILDFMIPDNWYVCGALSAEHFQLYWARIEPRLNIPDNQPISSNCLYKFTELLISMIRNGQNRKNGHKSEVVKEKTVGMDNGSEENWDTCGTTTWKEKRERLPQATKSWKDWAWFTWLHTRPAHKIPTGAFATI